MWEQGPGLDCVGSMTWPRPAQEQQGPGLGLCGGPVPGLACVVDKCTASACVETGLVFGLLGDNRDLACPA
jgi:hypothetical protein